MIRYSWLWPSILALRNLWNSYHSHSAFWHGTTLVHCYFCKFGRSIFFFLEEEFLINAKSKAFAIPFPKIMCFESLPGDKTMTRVYCSVCGGADYKILFWFHFVSLINQCVNLISIVNPIWHGKNTDTSQCLISISPQEFITGKSPRKDNNILVSPRPHWERKETKNKNYTSKRKMKTEPCET